jgi:hypothetical protein
MQFRNPIFKQIYSISLEVIFRKCLMLFLNISTIDQIRTSVSFCSLIIERYSLLDDAVSLHP